MLIFPLARARVPSHFSSKMWSGESNGASRLSASIGLITCVYGSKDGIRSAGLRGLEARLQRGHEVLRRLHLVLVHEGREDEAAVEGTDRDKLLLLPEDGPRDGHLARPHERLAEQLERLQADLFRPEVVVPLPV